MKSKKINLIIFVVSIMILTATTPIFLNKFTCFLSTRSNFEIIQLVISIISTESALIVLWIMYLLYDKYGLIEDSIKKEKENILKLYLLLKNKMLIIQSDKYNFPIHMSSNRLKDLLKLKEFDDIKNKNIAISIEEYNKLFEDINIIKHSIYLPDSIRNKVNILEASVFLPMGKDDNQENYVMINHKKTSGKLYKLEPKTNIETFINNLISLFDEILKWFEENGILHNDDISYIQE